MNLGLANKCTWLQVHSVIVYLMLYQISRVYISLISMQHRHMVYLKVHRRHYLVLDQSARDSNYLSLLCYEAWNLDHKMVILGISLCYNLFSNICVKDNHYLEHGTVCLSIFFPWIFLPWSMTPFCDAILSDVVGIP